MFRARALPLTNNDDAVAVLQFPFASTPNNSIRVDRGTPITGRDSCLPAPAGCRQGQFITPERIPIPRCEASKGLPASLTKRPNCGFDRSPTRLVARKWAPAARSSGAIGSPPSFICGLICSERWSISSRRASLTVCRQPSYAERNRSRRLTTATEIFQTPACNFREYLPFTPIRCDIEQTNRELPHMAKDPERMSFKELQEFELKVKKAKTSVQERSRSELRQKLEFDRRRRRIQNRRSFRRARRQGPEGRGQVRQSRQSVRNLDRARPQAPLARSQAQGRREAREVSDQVAPRLNALITTLHARRCHPGACHRDPAAAMPSRLMMDPTGPG